MKETRLKFSQGSVTVLLIVTSCQKAKVKLTNTQLNKLESAAKNKTETILRINKKNFQDEELSHELFLTTRQTIKLKNAFANNMSRYIKLSKAQISKIIQSGRTFGSWLAIVGKKALRKSAILLANDNIPGLVSILASNSISKFKKKISEKGAARAGKRFTLFISNEDINDVIKIIKSLIYGIAEKIKHKMKRGFLPALLASLATSLV